MWCTPEGISDVALWDTSLTNTISTCETPPLVGFGLEKDVSDVEPAPVGEGDVATEDLNRQSSGSRGQSHESQKNSAKEFSDGELTQMIPTYDDRREFRVVEVTTMLHCDPRDGSGVLNLEQWQRTTPKEQGEAEPGAYVLSGTGENPESEPPRMGSPDHSTPQPPPVLSRIMDNHGNDDGKAGASSYRKRQRGVDKGESDALSAISPTDNTEIIDLTSDNNATDPPILTKRRRRDNRRPEDHPPTKRQRKQSRPKVARPQPRVPPADQDCAIPRIELREVSITKITFPISFSRLKGQWRGPELSLKVDDEKIKTMFSSDWKEAVITAVPSTTR